jgi:mono/diheme cytochrome c family protein
MIMRTNRKLCMLAIIAAVFALTSLRSLGDEAQVDDWKAPAREARKKNPVPADEKAIAVGKNVYVHQCLSCHGDHGRGDGPAAKDLNPKPHNLGAPNIVAQTDGALFWKITEGKKPMPTFEKLISEDERWHVIIYIRTFASSPPPPATQPN